MALFAITSSLKPRNLVLTLPEATRVRNLGMAAIFNKRLKY